MFHDTIGTVLTGTFLIMLFFSLYCGHKKQCAVPGSRQRYVISTLHVTSLVMITLIFVSSMIINILKGDLIWAGADLACAAAWAYTAKKAFDNDNNWFNRKWKKFKKAVTRLKERLQSITLPSLAPAFG